MIGRSVDPSYHQKDPCYLPKDTTITKLILCCQNWCCHNLFRCFWHIHIIYIFWFFENKKEAKQIMLLDYNTSSFFEWLKPTGSRAPLMSALTKWEWSWSATPLLLDEWIREWSSFFQGANPRSAAPKKLAAKQCSLWKKGKKKNGALSSHFLKFVKGDKCQKNNTTDLLFFFQHLPLFNCI